MKGRESLTANSACTRVLAILSIFAVFIIVTVTAFTQESKPVADPACAEVSAGVTGKEQPKGKGEKVEPPAPEQKDINPALITATAYPFTSAGGAALEDMSSGTTQLVAANLDDNASAVTNIGFEFWYDGVRFTQFSVNANGLCRLGATAVSTSFDNSTAFNSTTNAPKIAPYYDDLWVGTNGKVHFKVVGSAPSRKLVVEWLNMQIPRVAAGNAGAGTFQMWINETTGVIEFVYGSGVALNSANGGYSIGLQSGAATNFASVTTLTSTVSYAAANNTQTNAVASGTKYTFTPNVPAAPTALNFTAVMASSMTLNWTDNATNEVGYVIYNSTDGTNFTFLTQTAANATSQNVTGLNPSTTYFWRVFAVTEGALSTVLAGSQATAAPGIVNSTAAGGNWSAPATWAGGVVPSSSDNVTIVNGATVTIDTAASALNLTVNGVLQYEATTARTLTVGQSVTIGGVFQTAATGTVTTHILSVGGNLTNGNTLDFSTNANTAGASIIFTGAANAMFTGTGPTTDVRAITVNKGTSSASILELSTDNFTVRGAVTDVAGFLTLTNGTFKISLMVPVTNRVFTTAIYTIPATAGIWLNSPNFVVAGTISSTTTTNNGLFRVTQGTYNIGVGAGDEMGGGTGAVFIIEGTAVVNASGRLDPQSAVSYTQTGGTVNVATVGNTRSLFGSFEIFNTASSFTMSGGTINVINRNTGATQVDFDVLANTTNVTGGLLVIGATGAPAATTYHVQGTTPNLTINATMNMIVTTNASATFPLFMRGTTVTNNGTITSATTGSPRFDFTGNGPMTYTGGTFGTPATPFAGVGVSANSTSLVTLNSPIVTNRVNLFQGGFINSNQITLGNGGASTTVVQIGSTGLTTPGGSFDVSPSHMQGTGGEIIIYAFETATRTTGVEINPTRILTSMTVDNPNHVTIAGGDLTLSSTAAALTMTNGRIITGANTLALSSGTATVTRTNGYVDGNYRKTYSVAASKSFEVGTANGFSPVTVNVTAATFPTDFTVKAVQGPQPNILSPQNALQRYWTLTATGVTADLTFNYLDPPDVPVTANENNFVIFKYDGSFSMPGGTVNTAANTATVTAVTSFSDWTLAEPNAPTDIHLISFTADAAAGNAKGAKGGVALRWQTGYEAANLGFNVYRDEGGKPVRVTPDLIAGSALFVGARTVLAAGRSYVWRDTSQQATPETQYWLEEMDLNGRSIWHGPVKSTVSVGKRGATEMYETNSKLLTDLSGDSSRQWASAPVELKANLARFTPARLEAQSTLAGKSAVKMTVDREGWYRVGQPELAAAGFDTSADPRVLQVFVDGQEQPINVLTDKQGQLTAIEFYGVGVDNAYTDKRTYWLAAGINAGRRITVVQDQGGSPSQASFPYTVERRDRTIYFSSLRNGERENFFGAVIARDPVDQAFNLQHVDQSSTAQPVVEVALQGVTTAIHSVKVQLNGHDAGDIVFTGQSQGVARLSVNASLLKEGANVVRLMSQAGQIDVSLVDYIRLTYQHTYAADNDVLRLNAAGRQQVTVSGFSNDQVRVIDATNPSAVQELIGAIQKQKDGSFSITITAPGNSNHTLLAFTNDQARRAVDVIANQPSDWQQPSNGADLVIIARGDLLASLEPLKLARQKQGLTVATVDIQDVYDEFSYGQKTPQAVKDFLYYARGNWKKAPRYVLFVGDSSLDPKNYLGFGDSDLVSTRFIDTEFMETVSDDWFTDFNLDGVPELAVGRLPVRNAAEASSLVAKIVGYDQQKASDGVLLVADSNYGYDFEGANARLRRLVPPDIRVQEIDRGRVDDATARGQLLEAIASGQKLVNYTGHGSVEQWRGNLLTIDDGPGLENSDHLSMFVMMTCLNGYYQDAALDSLAESLLKAERGGAVAVWASSSMTTPAEQSILNQQLYRLLFSGDPATGKPLTIGEAVARAKAAVIDQDIRRTWILFGDPTTRLK